jgi:hypothetical protein
MQSEFLEYFKLPIVFQVVLPKEMADRVEKRDTETYLLEIFRRCFNLFKI